MNLDKAHIISSIKQKVMQIAASLDGDASDLLPTEIIPATGAIDSAGLLELIAWFESEYKLQIPTQDFTIDNLGSMELMANYLLARKTVS